MMTKAFALNGAAKVYIVGRRKEKLDEAAKLSPHGNIIPLVGDVTSKESLIQVAEQVKQDIGHVNLVCCNSGGMPPPIPANPSLGASVSEFAQTALKQSMADWNDAFASMFTGVAFTAFSFLELLDTGNQRRGPTGAQSQIVITSSVASFLRIPGSSIPYGCSKAAVTQLTKHFASLFVPYNIRCNAIAPGLFPSDLASGLISMGGEPKNGQPTVEGAYESTFIPARRLGSEQDMAGTLLYLASPAGGYLNGCILLNDGGRLGLFPATY